MSNLSTSNNLDPQECYFTFTRVRTRSQLLDLPVVQSIEFPNTWSWGMAVRRTSALFLARPVMPRSRAGMPGRQRHTRRVRLRDVLQIAQSEQE